MKNQKHKVIIAGGGFGGVKAAQELAKSNQVEVVLVSDYQDFHYHASLYHAATGGSRAQSMMSLKDLFDKIPVKLVVAKVAKLDRRNKYLVTSSGKKLKYDSLILAIGAVTNYFGIKGLEEYSFGIKNYQKAMELKTHLHKQLIDTGQPDYNYIVVGGGPTGVELAGVLPGYIKQILKKHCLKNRVVQIKLVEANRRVLPNMPRSTSQVAARRLKRLGVRLLLDKKVSGETLDDLIVEGVPIKSHTVIWTAGVTNNPFFAANKFKLSENGRVEVNEHLEAEVDIFVIGDNADTPFSGMAQTAIRDGHFVAENILRRIKEKPLETYNPKEPVYLTPIGPHWAAVRYKKWHLYGRLGWLARRFAEFMAYRDLEPWWKASRQWLAADEVEETCSYCKKI